MKFDEEKPGKRTFLADIFAASGNILVNKLSDGQRSEGV